MILEALLKGILKKSAECFSFLIDVNLLTSTSTKISQAYCNAILSGMSSHLLLLVKLCEYFLKSVLQSWNSDWQMYGQA